MKTRCLILLLLFYHSGSSQSGIEKPQHLFVGCDLSQFNYMVGSPGTWLNAGVVAQYKPFYFLSINSSFTLNSIHEQRGQSIYNLKEYHSRGTCLKLGFDLSVRLGPEQRHKRAFIGYQSLLMNYRESGQFKIENGWADHIMPFDTKNKLGYASEIIFGFQSAKKRWMWRMQFYSVFLKDDTRVSYNNKVVEGYRSPFIPGFGFRRGGLNLILAFRLGKE